MSLGSSGGYDPKADPQVIAYQMYREDKMSGAYDFIRTSGQVDDSMIAAETEVREAGRIMPLNDWLSMEYIEHELADDLDWLTKTTRDICEGMSRRFSPQEEVKTLVTILSTTFEAKWMEARWGYYVSKVPYGKICLPFHLVQDPHRYAKTLTHEFMHSLTSTLSHDRISSWMGEAFSTWAEGRTSDEARIKFKAGTAKWLSPSALNVAVSEDNRNEAKLISISLGYAQANLIAQYIVQTYGEQKIGEILASMNREDAVYNLVQEFTGRRPVDQALRSTCHVSEAGIFEKALEWVKSS